MNLPRIFPGLITATLGLLVALCQVASADIKSATVNVNKLITEYHVAKKEISALQGERDEYVKEREERQKALKGVEDKLKALFAKLRDKAMPKAERDNLDEEKEDLVSQYNALTKDLKESDLGQINQTKEKLAAATRRLLDEIQIVIHQYAKDNGYHWIIDTSGVSNTQISPLVYAKDAKDVTEEILAILNKDAPKDEENSKPKTPETNPEQPTDS
ncbi:MAG: OmpH family outer membrane protein [Akkermansiaceae bacterium]|nr:OmpH family outer membrane protein [Akkermansiaceae bacterium]